MDMMRKRLKKKKMAKKGVELSLNVIIIAVLCLIVLVVIILIFRGQIGEISKAFFGISKNVTSGAEEQTGILAGLFGRTDSSTGDSKESTEGGG